MTTLWKTQIELPAIVALSDDSPWVTLRGSEFEDQHEARSWHEQAKAQHEFPLRFIRSMQLGGGAVEEDHEPLSRMVETAAIPDIARSIADAMPFSAKAKMTERDYTLFVDRVQAILVATSRGRA